MKKGISFLEHLENLITNFVWKYTPDVILAVVILVIGILVIKFIRRLLHKILKRSKNVEASLRTFIESLSAVILYFILFAAVGITLGIKTTSFLTVFGAAGLAIGLALQGSLANFAGGILILIFKPFQLENWVEIDGVEGFVQKINILYTEIRTFDHRIITMPNGKVANSNIDNKEGDEIRRINHFIKVSINENFEEIKDLLMEAMKQHPDVLTDPAPSIWLNEVNEYYMTIYARSFVKMKVYYPMYWIQLENMKKALDKKGVIFPSIRNEITSFHGTLSTPEKTQSNR